MKHLLSILLYILFLGDGLVMVGVGYTDQTGGRVGDMLIFLSGLVLMLYSVVNLVRLVPKVGYYVLDLWRVLPRAYASEPISRANNTLLKEKLSNTRLVLLSLLFLLFLMDGFILSAIGYVVFIINWGIDGLISVSGIILISHAVTKLVYYVPKINSY